MNQTHKKFNNETTDQLFLNQKIMDTSDIKAILDNDTIILRGSVPNVYAKIAAEYDALNIAGANSFKSELFVKPPILKNPKDKTIMSKIDSLLTLYYNINSKDIYVSIDEGNVILEGEVNTFWKKRIIETEIEKIPGILSILNKIVIIPTKNIVDKNIAYQIQQYLNLLGKNEQVDLNKINLFVKNRVVKLSGIVENWDIYETIINTVRFLDDVFDVKDHLIIKALSYSKT